MMPLVGVDLVPIRRIEALVADQDGLALRRMLTPSEIENCIRAGRLDVWSVAGRLAAKEAVFKLFDAGHRVVPWTGIHIEGGVECSPVIRLTGNARSLASSAGICSGISISISHDGDYAVAVAVAISNLRGAHEPNNRHHDRRRQAVDSRST
jgi:holo-[acyl-carrier protein] synthase